MADYFEQGRELIVDVAKAQLGMMQRANQLAYASGYGSSDIFELALRRVGEDELADKFVNPNPDARFYVARTMDTNSILNSVLSNLQRGNTKFAQELERGQREAYLSGVGYIDPHWFFDSGVIGRRVRSDAEKERLRQSILEKGIEGSEKHEQRVRDTYEFHVRGERPHLWDGRYNENGQIADVSLPENLYAVMINLALGENDHASAVLNDIWQTYREPESGLLLRRPGHIVSPVHSALVMRAMDMAGSPQGKKLFEQYDGAMMEMLDSEGVYRRGLADSSGMAFVLNHFGREDQLRAIKEKISVSPVKIKTESESEDFFGFSSADYYTNGELCRRGLALTGLEKGHFNYFLV